MDRPEATVTPNMVAVGNSVIPGTISTLNANQQTALSQCPIPIWRPRDGRNSVFRFWEDALMDAVALLGIKQEDLHILPPVCPTDETLTAHSYGLWYNAMVQWQREGTRLFDLVRPTLDLKGPHADQDLRRLRGWKCNDIRDGRALLQWALSFVDRSSVEGQMELLKQISSMTLDPDETLFGLSEHLFKLWELWLDISSNDRNAPAAFLSQLLTSMPVAPECPIVHVRRYLADLVRKKDSYLLSDIDGDKGLFANMIDYGKMLGLQDLPRSALLLLGSSAKPAGGAPAGGGRAVAIPSLTRRRATATSALRSRARRRRAGRTAASACTPPSSTRQS